jgi:TPR repeat protein
VHWNDLEAGFGSPRPIPASRSSARTFYLAFRQAAEWFLKSAEQECEIAQINLGYLLENGKGVPVDYPEAQKWYRLAMARGNARAEKAMTSLAAIMTQKQLRETSRGSRYGNKERRRATQVRDR